MSICKALFLDRDGVINLDYGYVHHQSKFKFIDGIFDLSRAAHSLQYKLVVITNQSGIGRGYYSERQFHELTDWMCDQFRKNDAPIEKVFFSPFHATEGIGKYKIDHFSRKPNPGMILNARDELNLNLNSSVLIGDKLSDIQAGIAGGIGCNIFFSQTDIYELSERVYQHRISSLTEAIPLLTCRNLLQDEE